jgi:hypothetical protein
MMSTSATATASGHALRLDQAAVALLAATPVVMVFSTRSSPVMLALAVLLGIAAAVVRGEGDALLRGYMASLRTPLAALVALGLGLMALSLAWTPDIGHSGPYLAQLAGNALLIPAALLVVPRVRRGDAGRALGGGIIAAAILILIELATNGAILNFFGHPPIGAFRVNRVVVSIVILTPIAAAFFWRSHRLILAGGMSALVVATAFVSASGAAVLGSVLALAALALSWRAPRVMARVTGILALACTLAMPWIAAHVNDAVPASIHQFMQSASSQIRGEIWRNYALLIQDRPLFGYGLEASRGIAWTDAVAAVPSEALEYLRFGHPHNAPLQIWFELGAVGAAIALAILAIAAWRLTQVPDRFKPFAVAAFAAAFAVACISHGAWQAWWISVLGIALVWWRVLMISSLPARQSTGADVRP